MPRPQMDSLFSRSVASGHTKVWEALWVEDDERLVRALQRSSPPWLQLTACQTAADARRRLANGPYEAALIDLCLGGSVRDGLALVRELHTAFPDLGLVVFSGWDSVPHREQAFDEGAHDFASKGEVLNPRELGKRLIVAARRARASAAAARAPLTEAEERLFSALKGRSLVTTHEIATRVLGRKDESQSTHLAVQQLVSRLRRKLHTGSGRERILAVRGVGYRLGTMDS